MTTRKKIVMAFEPNGKTVKLSDILPVKRLPATFKATKKYQQIAASITEVRIIEPPVVARHNEQNDKYLLLDGHARIEVLKELGVTEVLCLIATDDEAFTYNKRINRLATIQEHKMILKAIERGVSEEQIAKALNVNIASIRRKRSLLDGICPEAEKILKNKHCPVGTFQTLKKMSSMRQIEVASLMDMMNNFSIPYAKAALLATPQTQLVNAGQAKTIKGISPEQIERMESEMAGLQDKIKQIDSSYGPDHLNLVLARGFVVSLLNNSKITRYLAKHFHEILTEFEKITEMSSMGAAE